MALCVSFHFLGALWFLWVRWMRWVLVSQWECLVWESTATAAGLGSSALALLPGMSWQTALTLPSVLCPIYFL